MILKDGKILLGRRHDNEPGTKLRGAGTWTMPGGKLEFGESFEQCAAREVYEETGIRLKSVKVMCVNNDKDDRAHFVTIGLFSDDFEGEAKAMEPNKIVEWQWFDLDHLPQPLFLPSEKMIGNYKRGSLSA